MASTSSKMLKIGNAFKQYFEIVPAFSEALKDEVYRIRHQVYCEELQFESIRQNRREIDKYDTHSLHILIRHVQTNEFIGCVRIVHPQHEDPLQSLPFEKTCANVLTRDLIDPAKLPRNKIAEASRLAVIGRYRRRKGEASTAISISDQDFGTSQQPRFPYIPIALYLSTFNLAHLNGIDYLFSLTEERLANHFNKLGFRIQFIGDAIEHRGTRFPSVMNVKATINGIRPILRPLYQIISTDITKYIKKTNSIHSKSS